MTRRHVTAPHSKSGYRGVYFCQNLKYNPWKAYIRIQGRYVTLGYFPTKEEASVAYNKAARNTKGAYLNPVPKS